MPRFTDKVVIVTAAASGIGLAAARRFAAEGATLSLSDIDLDALERHAADLGLPEGRLRVARVDVSKPAEVEVLVADTVSAFGGLDVLVNNAGVGAFGYVSEITPEVWDRTIATTLSSVFYASRASRTATTATLVDLTNNLYAVTRTTDSLAVVQTTPALQNLVGGQLDLMVRHINTINNNSSSICITRIINTRYSNTLGPPC